MALTRDEGVAGRMVELASGIDAFYLSAQGVAQPMLLADLEAARTASEKANVPVDFDLCGYPVKVQPSAWGKYAAPRTNWRASASHPQRTSLG